MSLLTPLGLLGLLSIVALIIIYIIRPNYQEKYISTTFVWNLSLKYRKKRIPTSKLRNILLIICQVLILLLSTAILTTPSEVLKETVEEPEVVLVLDSSASMRTQSEGDTRFKRAIDLSKEQADEVFGMDGTVSVIIADDSPEFVLIGIKRDTRQAFDEYMNGLLAKEEQYLSHNGESECTYGVSDLETSIEMCAEIFDNNPSAHIYVYTDYQYVSAPTGALSVVDVTVETEWNAAILSATAEKVNGYYLIEGQVACYNRSEDITIELDILDVNGSESYLDDVNTSFTVRCTQNVPATFMAIFVDGRGNSPHSDYLNNFNTTEEDLDNYVTLCYVDKGVYSFGSINLRLALSEEDCLEQDNNFSIYGGTVEEINAQYYSTGHNPFLGTLLDYMRSYYYENGMWDLYPYERYGEEIETMGYDLYIFEHHMPETLPTDGVVIMIDPDNAPIGSGFTVAGTYDFNKVSVYLTAADEHPIGENLSPTDITVSRYQRLVNVDDTYTVVMELDGYPMLMVKNDGLSKIVVLPFSLHYSNLPLREDFVYIFENIFNYFFPQTTAANYYEVGEEVLLNSRSETLALSGNGVNKEFTSYEGADEVVTFPVSWTFYTPGTYTLEQTTVFDKYIKEDIFIKAPASESNIFAEASTLNNPYGVVEISDFYRDLLLYFAIALVALLFVEWILQARDNL